MCKHCVKTPFPDRGDCCLDAGVYLLNYIGCIECKKRGTLLPKHKTTTEDEGDDGEYEEELTFDHCCPSCGHCVAEHFYSFNVGKENHLTVQNYLMSCLLCGKGGDRRIIETEETTPEVSAETKSSTNAPSDASSDAPSDGSTTATTTPYLTFAGSSSMLARVSKVVVQQIEHAQEEEDDDWD
jgi:hypothetical protein